MIALLALSAGAWETHVDAAAPWSSLQAEPNQPLDEHGRLLDEAMITIDPAWSAKHGHGARQSERPLLVDYNATWWRHGTVPVLDVDGSTIVQERRMPRVSMLAGLPDISFSVTDWINHNGLCPVLPAEGAVRPDLCHDYGGYLGAGLNATHFGALATRMYARHHAIAVAEAEHAGVMYDRLSVDTGGLPDGSVWHRDALREAELLALTFEGTGQHYLQDRLAVGHMFGRWGSGAYSDLLALTDSDPLVHAQAMGLLSGIQHGSFAVFGAPDGMNFPEDGRPSVFRWDGPNAFGTDAIGIGDDLRAALTTGQTPQGRFDFELQRKVLLTCSAGGLRDVASRFHDNADGTFGVDRVELQNMGSVEIGPARPMGFDPSAEPGCTEAWVTNETYYRGSKIPTGEQAAHKLVAKLVGKPELGVLPETGAFLRLGPMVVINRAWAFANMVRSPNGVESARDGLAFDLDGFWVPNGAYDVPPWVEPVDLSELPDESADGRDLQSVVGLFHRAHPEWTCSDLDVALEALRTAATDPKRSQDDRNRAAATCASMARVAWRGTDPGYEGPRAERAGRYLPDETHAFGDTYEPLCAYWHHVDDVGETRTDDASDDGWPYWIHPGYADIPGTRDAPSGSFASLDAWCRKAPVLDIDADDVAGRLDSLDADRFVTLNGRNLGFRTTSGARGAVAMQDPTGTWRDIPIWDSAAGGLGGWGDTNGLDILVPLASQGFPSNADVGALPHHIKDEGAVAHYALNLQRADDPAADAIFLADAATLVSPVVFALEPSWVELAVQPIPPDREETGFWVERPDAHQDDLTVLALGFYRLEADGSYTPLDIPFTQLDDRRPVSDTSPLEWETVPDSLGIHVVFGGDLTPAVFAQNDVSLFYAYH